ncbi:MAG: NUDIX domain-containing protein [Eubacterium sp.]
MEEYIKKIRKEFGHERLILNFAGCILFDEQNRLILQKRADCGKYGFFGGMVEPGESVAEAAVREVKEESGLDVEIASFFGVYSKYFAEYENGDKAQPICHIFKAKIIGGNPIDSNSETSEIGYFNLENLPELFCRQHRDILDDLINGREFVFR